MLRVGCPDSLAARLYIDNLGDRVPPHTVVNETPAKLAGMLADGSLDAALVPSCAYYAHRSLVLIPDASVSAGGECQSAFLVARKQLQSGSRVALDPAYPAESLLVRVLLGEKEKLSPDYVEAGAAEAAADGSTDAFMACGELGAADAWKDLERIDLGQAWWRFARLPFVFAVWAARKGTDLKGFEKSLGMAKREGLRHAREFAGKVAPLKGLAVKRVVEYLTRVLNCNLSTAELGGMEAFHRYAVKRSLVEERSGIDYYR